MQLSSERTSYDPVSHWESLLYIQSSTTTPEFTVAEYVLQILYEYKIFLYIPFSFGYGETTVWLAILR